MGGENPVVTLTWFSICMSVSFSVLCYDYRFTAPNPVVGVNSNEVSYYSRTAAQVLELFLYDKWYCLLALAVLSLTSST